jgi:hypothetical protein
VPSKDDGENGDWKKPVQKSGPRDGRLGGNKRNGPQVPTPKPPAPKDSKGK